MSKESGPFMEWDGVISFTDEMTAAVVVEPAKGEPHESILEEAQRLIHGPRNKNYGHPRENFADTAALFSGYLGQEITDIDVANLMILVKIARVKGTGYHRDSFTDIAGYAGCVERIYEEPES